MPSAHIPAAASIRTTEPGMSAELSPYGTATCDTGDVATGGGYNAYTAGASDAQASVRYNSPEGENGWHVEVDNFTGQPVAVYAEVFVRCADVTP